MRQTNRKTPLVFRISLVLLCAMVISTYMIGGLYARYMTTASGSDTAKTAKISCKVTPVVSNNELNLSSHPLDANAMPADCNVVAIKETFTIENNGEVSYNYALTLSFVADQTNQEPDRYTLTSISDSAWIPSSDGMSGELKPFVSGKFYYYLGNDDEQKSLDAPTLTGRLNVGETVTYSILYFVTLEEGVLNQQRSLKYSVVCTQID